MKILKQAIKVTQFIMAILIIFAFGQWSVNILNDIFNFSITAYNLFTFSFLSFLILALISYFITKKE